jgi:hypothetical protein
MNQKDMTPKWLEELQQKSWEPEILLSGIVLYGMFKMPELLDQGLIFFKSYIFGQTSDVDNLVMVLKVAIYWLIAGLVLHLISRGIWVGMVGLSYTFDQGINTDNLNYQGKFKDKVNRIPKFQTIIVNLEKICSSLFSVSFMLFMVMIGAYFYLFILLLLPFFSILFMTNNYDHWAMEVFEYYTIVLIVFGLLGMLDFITVGYFRRFKWIAKVYWPIHRLISFLTFSRYYRGIYYGLVSNVNKWYIFLFLLIFTVTTFFAFDTVDDGSFPGEGYSRLKFWHNRIGVSAFSGYYDDQNSELYSVRASIPSDIVTNNTLRLFIVADINFQDSLEAMTKREPLKTELDSLPTREKSHKLISSFYRVVLDDSVVNDYPLKFHYKSHTHQFGYLVYLDITNLQKGMHTLSIKGPEKMFGDRTFASIPFYREYPIYTGTMSTGKQNEDDGDQLKSLKPLMIN